MISTLREALAFMATMVTLIGVPALITLYICWLKRGRKFR